MKLSLFQLSSHLQHSLSSLYIIASAEPLLTQQVTKAIKQAAQKKGFKDAQNLSLTQKEEWEQLRGLSENLDLFRDHLIIQLYIPNAKPSPQGIQQIQDYLKNPPENQILIIIIDKIENALLSSQWIKQLEPKGILIPIWPLSPQDFRKWLQQRLNDHHIQLEKESFLELIHRTEGNLIAAEQAIQQLTLFPQPITHQVLKTLITDQAQYAIKDFIQALLQRHYSTCLRILQRLQDHQVEPTWIIWQLAQTLRQSPSIGKALLPLLTPIEISIKNGDTLNPWLLLKDLVYRTRLLYP